MSVEITKIDFKKISLVQCLGLIMLLLLFVVVFIDFKGLAQSVSDMLEQHREEESNEDGEDFRSYKSTFAPQINITVVFKEYDKYKDLKSLFKEYGYGFYSPKTKTIIIDGEVFIDSNLTFNDLKFVEAHEISHLIMNHSGPRSDEDELDADLGAYILLKSQNLPVDNLKKQFKFRHGIEFNEKLLDRVKDKF